MPWDENSEKISSGAAKTPTYGRPISALIRSAFNCAVVRSVRTLLNTLYSQYRPSHDIIGFKEVRYGLAEVELLRKCYPAAKMLLLVRHPCNTWNSTPRDWYPHLDEWIALWNSNAQAFLFLDASDANCHLIRYEDLVKRDPAALQIISDTARLTNEQIAEVLACKLWQPAPWR